MPTRNPAHNPRTLGGRYWHAADQLGLAKRFDRKPRLWSIAHRIVGSLSEAGDAGAPDLRALESYPPDHPSHTPTTDPHVTW